MAQAANTDYSVPETDTLEEATAKFTLVNLGTYISNWGTGYTK
jgi:hypothetical protein